MKDLMKNECFLKFSLASKSLSDNINYNSKDVSLGYLILALRWCRDHTELRQKIFSIPAKSLQVIVDYSIILLGTEISHYYLLGTPDIVTKDIDKQIHEQILQLFDQVDSD